jgi:hypothetical protein
MVIIADSREAAQIKTTTFSFWSVQRALINKGFTLDA